MKKIIITAILMFAFGNIMNAQIKVVGEEYMDSLTATKNYYDRDIDFERVFPSIPPHAKIGNLYSFLSRDYLRLNLTGDTIYLLQPYELRNREFAINSKGKAISTLKMPAGYYIISGYVFCIENENSVREAAGLSPFENGYLPENISIHDLKKDILRNGRGCQERYLRYVVLTSIDTVINPECAMSYYCCPLGYENPFERDKNIYLRFYNEACKFIGTEMVYGSITYDSLSIIKNVVKDDGITGEPIKLRDNSYVAKDVVMKGSYLYLILQGEKTGSFAQKIDQIVYGDVKSDFTNTPFGRENELNFWNIAGFLIKWDSKVYWFAKNDAETIYNRQKIDQQLMIQQIKDRYKEQRELFRQKMIAKYGSENGQLVGNKRIAIGMTKEMCKDAWGMPMDSYRTTTKYGQSEVWCYNYKTRVYFFDGKVVKIDN